MAASKWYREGLKFECTQCGDCCSGEPGYVWVTKKDIETIANYLGRKDGKLNSSEVRRVHFKYSLTEKKNGDCIFLTRENGKIGCAIYPVRPIQCRTWPFWNTNLSSIDAWNTAHTRCPGMNCGKHFDLENIERIRTAKNWDDAKH